MPVDLILNFLIGVIYVAAILVLVSLGLAVIFGMMGVINFAHGEFLMLGAFITLTLTRAGTPLWISMLAATASMGILGMLIERTLIRSLYGRVEATMLATFGLSLILVQLAIMIWGASTPGIPTPLGRFAVGSYNIAIYRLVLIAAALAFLGVTWLVLTRTKLGLMARAAAMDADMAAAVGIDARRINMYTFAFGAALAGAGGSLIAPIVAVTPTLGVVYVPQAFMTVVVGGAAAITGTATASGLLGLVSHSTSSIAGPVLGVSALLFTAIILLRILPTGISGRLGRDL